MYPLRAEPVEDMTSHRLDDADVVLRRFMQKFASVALHNRLRQLLPQCTGASSTPGLIVVVTIHHAIGIGRTQDVAEPAAGSAVSSL
jgi:hypothetical protein